MKKVLLFALGFAGILSLANAQNTILEARGMAIGTVVTVKGIVTNGAELGVIRYFQDNTAGIAAYGSVTSVANRGDSVTITGTLKNYNQLLELDPVTNVTVRNTGNPVPDPIILTPGQIGETYEGRLVKCNYITFADGGGVFTGNKTYQFSSSNGETGIIYVKTAQTDIVGQPIPSGPVNLTAICSQFHYSDPNAGYQLLPRTIDDIEVTSSIFFINTLTNTNFTQTQLDFSWNTNIAGTTEMFYGSSPENIMANHITGTGGVTSHNISVTDASAGSIVWVSAFSVNGTDTAFSGIIPFATISNSSGDIKIYFNSDCDHSYSNGVNAINLYDAIDDTLISYINRAKYTIDLTMYNFNNTGISNVSNALKAAANRGVLVRVIGCGTTANLGIDELAGSNVHVLVGPSSSERNGIMHNKFIIFDAESTNPNDALVWTGSTNLTDSQINTDANNVIIIQDQSLARTYKIEFEEMWGSNGSSPNAATGKFGSNKRNNTPHEFIINGKRIECYFSPTDGVNAKIVNNINSADHDLSIATMLITRNEMANAIVDVKDAGAAVNVLTNAEGNNGATVNTILSAALGTHYVFDDVLQGIMHNKYMVIDQGEPASDPIAWTGSHNWSAAADNDNDENTLVVHDATIANIYYQNFVSLFLGNDGVLFELTGPPTAVNDQAQTYVDQTVTVDVLANDIKQAPVTLSLENSALHGNAYIPFTNPNVISYQPATGFIGTDSVTYKIAYNAQPSYFATAKVIFTVLESNGIADETGPNRMVVYPNPVKSGNVGLSCYSAKADQGTLRLIGFDGKVVAQHEIKLTAGQKMLNVPFGTEVKGSYLLKLTTSAGSSVIKVLFQ